MTFSRTNRFKQIITSLSMVFVVQSVTLSNSEALDKINGYDRNSFAQRLEAFANHAVSQPLIGEQAIKDRLNADKAVEEDRLRRVMPLRKRKADYISHCLSDRPLIGKDFIKKKIQAEKESAIGLPCIKGNLAQFKGNPVIELASRDQRLACYASAMRSFPPVVIERPIDDDSEQVDSQSISDRVQQYKGNAALELKSRDEQAKNCPTESVFDAYSRKPLIFPVRYDQLGKKYSFGNLKRVRDPLTANRLFGGSDKDLSIARQMRANTISFTALAEVTGEVQDRQITLMDMSNPANAALFGPEAYNKYITSWHTTLTPEQWYSLSWSEKEDFNTLCNVFFALSDFMRLEGIHALNMRGRGWINAFAGAFLSRNTTKLTLDLPNASWADLQECQAQYRNLPHLVLRSVSPDEMPQNKPISKARGTGSNPIDKPKALPFNIPWNNLEFLMLINLEGDSVLFEEATEPLFPNLTSLTLHPNIAGTRKYDEETVLRLKVTCPQLRVFKVWPGPMINLSVLSALLEEHPTLEEAHYLGNCPVIIKKTIPEKN